MARAASTRTKARAQMTNGTGYALAALLCYGVGDFIYKRSARAGVQANHFLTGQAWCFCPLVVLYAIATGTLVIQASALWGCLAGLFILFGFYQFLRSLVTGSVSINAPIFRLNFIVTALLAIAILGEPLTWLKLAGFALALAATWLLVGGATGGPKPEINRQSLLQVLSATLAFGAANFFHKMGLYQGMPPETMLAAQAIVFISLSTLLTGITEGTVRVPAKTWPHAVPAAIVLIAAFLFLLHGLSIGPASVLVPIAQMGFVITAALGIVLFGEPFTGRKAAGLSAAAVALAILAYG
jgi:drug/metabolite transporter (DMT)-like permease